MKKIYSLISIAWCLLVLLSNISCSDKDVYIQGVAGITLEGVEGNIIQVIEDDTYQIKVKVNPENAVNLSEYATFNYSSSNAEIFTVNAEGVITALVPGDAILTVSAKEDVSIKLMCMVRVEKRIFPVTSINTGGLEKGIFVEGMILNLSEYLTVMPENASNPLVTIESSDEEIAAFDEKDKNMLFLLKEGKVTITVRSTDGTDISQNIELTIIAKNAEIDFVSLDRTNWIITPSHTLVPDNGIGGNDPAFLYDEKTTTGLSLYKPGKKETPKEDHIGFTVELPTAISINAFRLTHRKFGYIRLSPFAIDLLGSNDGENFTVIQKGIPTPYVANSSDIEVTRLLPFGNTPEYKFIRIVYSNYDAANGDTVQVMEFELGTGTYN